MPCFPSTGRRNVNVTSNLLGRENDAGKFWEGTLCTTTVQKLADKLIKDHASG
jgi:hypothetical protein